MSARRRTAFVAAALVALLALGVGLYAWWPHRPAGLGGGSVPQHIAGPVLLVPGYGGGTGALERLAGRLRAQGRQPRIVQAVGDGRGNLREQAAALDIAVRETLADGAPSVDLIGYSAGGVTVRLWAREYDGRRVARRIVTLGSPHHGTDLASVGALFPDQCPEACRQLVPDSDLLQQLNSGDETSDGPRWTSIWTRDDQVVVPPDTARLAGATNVVIQDVCPGLRVDHGSLPTAPVAVGVVLRAVGPGLEEPPAASECEALRAEGAVSPRKDP